MILPPPLPDKVIIAMTKPADLRNFERLMYITRVYMRLFPQGWDDAYSVETTFFIGNLCRYVIPLRMAYDEPWKSKIQAYDRMNESNVFPWITELTLQYEVRHPIVKIWLDTIKRVSLFAE